MNNYKEFIDDLIQFLERDFIKERMNGTSLYPGLAGVITSLVNNNALSDSQKVDSIKRVVAIVEKLQNE